MCFLESSTGSPEISDRSCSSKPPVLVLWETLRDAPLSETESSQDFCIISKIIRLANNLFCRYGDQI